MLDKRWPPPLSPAPLRSLHSLADRDQTRARASPAQRRMRRRLPRSSSYPRRLSDSQSRLPLSPPIRCNEYARQMKEWKIGTSNLELCICFEFQNFRIRASFFPTMHAWPKLKNIIV